MNPGGPGNHETIWPKPILCNSLTQGASLSLRPDPTAYNFKVGNEAESFSDDPQPYSNHHSVWQTLFELCFWEQNLSKTVFAMERQCFSLAFRKENDDVIWRFMTSKHATSRYEVLHGNRSQTRNYYSFQPRKPVELKFGFISLSGVVIHYNFIAFYWTNAVSFLLRCPKDICKHYCLAMVPIQELLCHHSSGELWIMWSYDDLHDDIYSNIY